MPGSRTARGDETVGTERDSRDRCLPVGKTLQRISRSPRGPRTARILERAGVDTEAVAQPAQHDNRLTSFVNVCAASFSPSTIVRYGNN